MKRMESRASAAMRSASAWLCCSAGSEAAAVPSSAKVDMMIFLVMTDTVVDAGFDVIARRSARQSSTLRCVVEAGPLQLGQRADGTGDQHGAIDQMVGQFRRERGMRVPVGIDVGFDEGRCLLPNRIVAGHENNTAPHQRRNRIVIAGERSRRILIVRGIGSSRLLLD